MRPIITEIPRPDTKARRRRSRTYRTIPVWVARITEHTYCKGVHRINVVTKSGKALTLRAPL